MGREKIITGRGDAASGPRDPFAVDQEAAPAELELAWSGGGYNGFTADSQTWCAISSAGEVLTGGIPDELDRAIRADWAQRDTE
jgi:hypothetical protein